MLLNLEKMGNNASLPKGRRRSLRSFVRRNNSKRNLSHAFTIPDTTEDWGELLNINVATEEDLMTLPGINRETARNIVNHRKAIGRFRRIEDLALVRGVGAEKLELMRPEICVSTRRSASRASSRAPSYDSLKSNDSRVTNKSSRLINVNKATVFDLQGIPGITQEIAAGILICRNKKGTFEKIEDLLKVKHINRMLLENVARYLTLDDSGATEPAMPRPNVITNGILPSQSINKPLLKHQLPNGLTSSSIIDIFELLSTYSLRPLIRDSFKLLRNGESAIRICSWNLHEFSLEKANNLGVKEVICRTILETGISILALQDVTNASALRTICEELNKPTLRRVEEWKENSQEWNFCMLDLHDTKLGFLYDSGGTIDIELISVVESPEDTKSSCEALIAHFLVGDLNLQIVNLWLKNNVDIGFLHRKLADLISEEEFVLLCIDFSSCPHFNNQYLSLGGLKPVFPGTTNTRFPNLKMNNSTCHVANMLTNSLLNQNLTGYKNTINMGLTHLAIPNGWSWGGPVSPFCPIWIEIFLNHKSNDTDL